MKGEIIEHIQNLNEQGINDKINEDQINNLVNKIFDKKDIEYANIIIDSDIKKFLEKTIMILLFVIIKIKMKLVQKKLINYL